MLALADDAVLGRLLIAATRIPHPARSSWLRKLAHTIEDRASTTPCPRRRPRRRRHGPQARLPHPCRVSRRRDRGTPEGAASRFAEPPTVPLPWP